ncbi:hypothetical protein CYG49_00045 [Candidatus Saccharibacteria bacterium]|nr:MAG: hypothetical protein CYG49_00045 [Candidatus Saccharibacteria bacterium]
MHMLLKQARHFMRMHATMENGVLLVAALIAASLLWNTVNSLQRNFQLQQQVDLTKQENELIALENDTLEFQKRYYQSSEYMELMAREKLNKIAPGERVIILPPAPEAEAERAARAPRQERTNFEQWLYFFFGEQKEQR